MTDDEDGAESSHAIPNAADAQKVGCRPNLLELAQALADLCARENIAAARSARAQAQQEIAGFTKGSTRAREPPDRVRSKHGRPEGFPLPNRSER